MLGLAALVILVLEREAGLMEGNAMMIGCEWPVDELLRLGVEGNLEQPHDGNFLRSLSRSNAKHHSPASPHCSVVRP